MSVDAEHALVLVPTGSASPDFYGGQRVGSNRFADSLLALDARTGRLVWQQQLVHHDLWDYDLAAQPVLGDLDVQGVPVPAVIQATKTGMLYVFERTRGAAARFRSIEKPVPPAACRASMRRRPSRSPRCRRSCRSSPVAPRGRLGHHLLGSRPSAAA